MATQRTFSIIKPDAVRNGYAAAILADLASAGFKVVSIKKQSISQDQAKGFYAVHKDRPFFEGLTAFMAGGPLFLMVLEKGNAISDLRTLMGATNFELAAEGSLRKKYAKSLRENAIHGSDGEESAAFEIAYWFAGYELV